MNAITKVLSGIGILIAIYLFLSHGDKSINLIGTVLGGATNMIATLQGREI